jgi:hypothetical protein
MNISAISTAPGRNGDNQLEECRNEAAKTRHKNTSQLRPLQKK